MSSANPGELFCMNAALENNSYYSIFGGFLSKVNKFFKMSRHPFQ